MPRIVLDTNVWLDLLVFGDARVAALGAALGAGVVVAVSNDACRDEWCRVLAYPQLQLDPARQRRAVDHYDRLARRSDAVPAGPVPRCADPDDQKFLDLAVACGARWLLSRDAAVLALARRTERAGLFRIATPEAWCLEHPLPG